MFTAGRAQRVVRTILLQILQATAHTLHTHNPLPNAAGVNLTNEIFQQLGEKLVQKKNS